MDPLIETSNQDERAAFAAKFGSIFEHSPWIAEEAWAYRPFGSREDLLERMSGIVMDADDDRQLALLRAHPELGAKIRMTEESVLEQRGAGLDRLERDEAYIFGQLNAKYRERFGFPFIIAVRGLTPDMIADSMQKRMMNSATEEKYRALQEVCKIAAFRLEHMELDAG
ncbi:2-oxo-4-hydroxy-4-carboxy-5-ureidoimidazoline decarboxylase [Paenibacillus sp. LHD-117]|uniref:2-oxo-4-hydroxy-4-carboxy-5-ureidoimidazoline decarboxylase n=1 Tax=Paenibacillus sp. LHD-117 TaxID=3071412 RepID=UPI0027DF77E0|nr:2-oxo-4-hydroxy-4-carboxy-5-ureidoimidazoline decarboxylase [Paenibacillus sp. LHD-117]MDQ6419142.1 2-oxo-4-hydroxy-4-carboxy-5-ureidoimidazoline decarboxylase [Paenibacillus sp. LHD-117]